MKWLSIIIPTRREEAAQKAVSSIRKHTKDYEIILVEREGGLNEKINWGMRAATGDYLAVLHDDVEVTEGWADYLPDHVGAFKVAELGGRMEIWGGTGTGYHTDRSKPPDYSAFLVFSRTAYADVGPADEAYKEPGWQDNDMGKQIQAAGYSIECLPGKIIHHAMRLAPLAEENRIHFEAKWR